MTAKLKSYPTSVNLFLSGIAVSYLAAFASLYAQIPGLFGRNGILPVHRLTKEGFPESCLDMSIDSFISKHPTLMCAIYDLEISPHLLLELICLIGILLSIATVISATFRHTFTMFIFACLWILYLSCYTVGQTFLSFQWDILLLESGFLAIFVNRYTDIIYFNVRWLLFRLMFASAVVKLQSQCPTWWNLTALDWHYESQCIPVTLAWYAHKLPDWINHLSVVSTYIIEGPMSILFLLPIQLHSFCRYSRLLAAHSTNFLMILIIVTGNYNFFNFLTMVLTLSCMDNSHIIFLLSRVYKPLRWVRKQTFDRIYGEEEPRSQMSVAAAAVSESDEYSKLLLSAAATDDIPSHRVVDESEIGIVSNQRSFGDLHPLLLLSFDVIIWSIFGWFVVKYFSLSIHFDITAMKPLLDTFDWTHFSAVFRINSAVNFASADVNKWTSWVVFGSIGLGYLNILMIILFDFGFVLSSILTCCGSRRSTKATDISLKAVDGGSIAKSKEGIDDSETKEESNEVSPEPIHSRQQSRPRGFNLLCGCYARSMFLFSSVKSVITFVLGWFVGISIFFIAIVPFMSAIDKTQYALSTGLLPQSIYGKSRDTYLYTRRLAIANSYGLFRRMTGVGGRPEIEIYVSDAETPPDLDSILDYSTILNYNISDPTSNRVQRQMKAAADVWYPVTFSYKPGNLHSIPAYIAPHQPRLDWQMWFAALTPNYQSNPWFISFVYRLLESRANVAVLDLIDFQNYIFATHFDYFHGGSDLSLKKKKTRRDSNKLTYGYDGGTMHIIPNYITAFTYHYHYTSWSDMNGDTNGECKTDSRVCEIDDRTGQYWYREKKQQFLPVLSIKNADGDNRKDINALKDWMRTNGFLDRPIFLEQSQLSWIAKFVKSLRTYYRKRMHLKYGPVFFVRFLIGTTLAVRFLNNHVHTEGAAHQLARQ